VNNRTERDIQRDPTAERRDGLTPTNWWVITGGPSTGKSTLLERLSKRGYQITEEAARQIIDEEMARGKTLEEIRRDELVFQERALRRKEEIEDNLQPDDLVFLDRGIHGDTFAYVALSDLVDKENPKYRSFETYPREVVSVLKRRYKGVFLLDRLPYQKDYARSEDDHQAKMVNPLLSAFYRHFGYEPVIVPVLPIAERIQFVLNHVRSRSKYPNVTSFSRRISDTN